MKLNKEAFPQDGTLWTASHRDSTAILGEACLLVKILEEVIPLKEGNNKGNNALM